MLSHREVPRDGRIASSSGSGSGSGSNYFTVIGSDGAIRLYDSEASIGKYLSCSCLNVRIMSALLVL